MFLGSGVGGGGGVSSAGSKGGGWVGERLVFKRGGYRGRTLNAPQLC